nr:hypothetical protein CFP56_16213 [Quercus suber]
MTLGCLGEDNRTLSCTSRGPIRLFSTSRSVHAVATHRPADGMIDDSVQSLNPTILGEHGCSVSLTRLESQSRKYPIPTFADWPWSPELSQFHARGHILYSTWVELLTTYGGVQSGQGESRTTGGFPAPRYDTPRSQRSGQAVLHTEAAKEWTATAGQRGRPDVNNLVSRRPTVADFWCRSSTVFAPRRKHQLIRFQATTHLVGSRTKDGFSLFDRVHRQLR